MDALFKRCLVQYIWIVVQNASINYRCKEHFHINCTSSGMPCRCLVVICGRSNARGSVPVLCCQSNIGSFKLAPQDCPKALVHHSFCVHLRSRMPPKPMFEHGEIKEWGQHEREARMSYGDITWKNSVVGSCFLFAVFIYRGTSCILRTYMNLLPPIYLCGNMYLHVHLTLSSHK